MLTVCSRFSSIQQPVNERIQRICGLAGLPLRVSAGSRSTRTRKQRAHEEHKVVAAGDPVRGALVHTRRDRQLQYRAHDGGEDAQSQPQAAQLAGQPKRARD